LNVFVGAGRLTDEHQIGVGVPDSKDDLLAAERVELAETTVWTDLDAQRLERFCLRSEDSGGFNGGSDWFHRGLHLVGLDWFRRLIGFRGLSWRGLRDSAFGTRAPLWLETHTIDTELTKELEMGTQIVVHCD
jgi:hypothetical protein